MSNAEIDAGVSMPANWKTAYPIVEAAAKVVLEALPEGASLSTTALVDAIYSPDQARNDAVRSRIFKALGACAEHGLKPYVTLGPLEQIGHLKEGRRKLWHRANAAIEAPPFTCPTCKRSL